MERFNSIEDLESSIDRTLSEIDLLEQKLQQRGLRAESSADKKRHGPDLSDSSSCWSEWAPAGRLRSVVKRPVNSAAKGTQHLPTADRIPSSSTQARSPVQRRTKNNSPLHEYARQNSTAQRNRSTSVSSRGSLRSKRSPVQNQNGVAGSRDNSPQQKFARRDIRLQRDRSTSVSSRDSLRLRRSPVQQSTRNHHQNGIASSRDNSLRPKAARRSSRTLGGRSTSVSSRDSLRLRRSPVQQKSRNHHQYGVAGSRDNSPRPKAARRSSRTPGDRSTSVSSKNSLRPTRSPVRKQNGGTDSRDHYPLYKSFRRNIRLQKDRSTSSSSDDSWRPSRSPLQNQNGVADARINSPMYKLTRRDDKIPRERTAPISSRGSLRSGRSPVQRKNRIAESRDSSPLHKLAHRKGEQRRDRASSASVRGAPRLKQPPVQQRNRYLRLNGMWNSSDNTPLDKTHSRRNVRLQRDISVSSLSSSSPSPNRSPLQKRTNHSHQSGGADLRDISHSRRESRHDEWRQRNRSASYAAKDSPRKRRTQVQNRGGDLYPKKMTEMRDYLPTRKFEQPRGKFDRNREISSDTRQNSQCPRNSNYAGRRLGRSISPYTVRERIPDRRPPTYDGRSSWTEFEVQFNLVAEMNNWDSDRAAYELAAALRGPALSILALLTNEQRRDLRQLQSALKDRFDPDNMREVHRANLKGRRRQKGESLTELGQQIKTLSRRAYPTATGELAKQLEVNAFIDALGDIDMEWAVLRDKPKSVDEAVTVALQYESFLHTRNIRRPTGHTVRQLYPDDPPKPPKTSNPPPAQHGPQQEKNVIPNKKTCFYCREEGHFIANCPKRLADMKHMTSKPTGNA